AWLFRQPELFDAQPQLVARLYEPKLGLGTRASGGLADLLVRRMTSMKGRQRDWAEDFIVALDHLPNPVRLQARPDTKGWILGLLAPVPVAVKPTSPPKVKPGSAPVASSSGGGDGNWPVAAGRLRDRLMWLPVGGALVFFVVVIVWLWVVLQPPLNEGPPPTSP